MAPYPLSSHSCESRSKPVLLRITLKGTQNIPRISGGKIWLPYTVKTKDGARGCGAYELRPDDPSYPKIKEWLEAVGRCEWSFFPFRPGDELDQAEVDLFMSILPGLAMSTSQNRESRERGLQTIKESLFKLDGSTRTRARLGWEPKEPGLIRDINRPEYFN